MENDDNIQFVEMPDFGNMFALKKEKVIEKEYDSLYDELLDKCYPGKYKDEEEARFKVASDIYGQLKQSGKEIPEHALLYIRNRAIDEIGIHISTSKIFDRLKSLIDPENFINIEPYNGELVETSKHLYDQVNCKKDDIRALERLEYEIEKIIKYKEEDDDFKSLSGEKYLEKYPNGKYVDIVKKQIAEQAKLIEEDEDRYYAEKGSVAYLIKYPNGKYADDARNKIEDDDFKDRDAKFYLEIYPFGRHAKEADDYLNMKSKDYLKKYPDGRYKNEAEENIQKNKMLIIAGIVIVVAVCLYFLKCTILK